jgi:predicted AAA+ superfamily ATPase
MTIFDISQLSDQNKWWMDKKNIELDFKLSYLDKLAYRWDPNIRHYIKLDKDVIYTIRGPRQVGKTTLIKLLIKDLLYNQNIKPQNIFFWSFERNTPDELNKIIQTYFNWRIEEKSQRKYLFFDEICAVKDWSRELIYFANKGDFVNCSIVVTGSHSMDLKHSTELMPGRRGGSTDDTLDKIFLPMKFSEFVKLIKPEFKTRFFDLGLVKKEDRHDKLLGMFEGKIDRSIEELMLIKKELDALLEMYLLTGGVPSVINEYKSTDAISSNLFNVYISAVIGDLNRFNYKELYFKQILREIFVTLSSQISWNSFTKTTEIKSHNTIQDYITALEELYVAGIAYRCSIHDNRIHNFMKKIYVLDPFFFHALNGWANGKADYFKNAKENLMNLEIKSKLVEGVVYNHLCRLAYSLNPRDLYDPKGAICYYEDKNKKEVDFILIHDGKYYPFEVKYQATIANSDFLSFRSFNSGIMITKNELGMYKNYVKLPISLFLMLV